MYIEQLYTSCLAEAAYYIESNGEAVIIDPLREVGGYIEKANERGASIKYIFETHFHADFVSGHVDLANQTGATIVYGPTAKTEYDVHVASDGEEFSVGDVKMKVLHTPGHTMESSVFLLVDKEGKDYAIFTGDTLFIGDVGRPDLAIKSDLTKEDLAGYLYDSLRNKIMPLSDDVMVYPAHGAGSACGKNMSSETYSTLGEQKRNNYALQEMSKEEFVTQLIDGIAPPPQYFPKNAMLNKTGYEDFSTVLTRGTEGLTVEDVKSRVASGALILDARNVDEFQSGFIPGSMFIGLEGNFATWVGALIEDIKQEIILVVEEGKEEEAVTRLARVGYDNAVGFLKGGVQSWVEAGNELESINQITSAEFVSKKNDSMHVLDVRKPGEFQTEHLTNAINFPLDYINSSLSEVNKDSSYYVHCKAGYRSMVAISILKRNGINNLIDIEGGFDALLEHSPCLEGAGCPNSK